MMNGHKAQHVREGSFGFLIQSLGRKVEATLKEHLEREGIDIKTFSYLMMLSEEDGINQRQLGKKLSYPEYFTSRNIDVLVKAGLAERQPDPNSRRSFLVFLTQAGREKSALLPKIVQQTNALHLEILSDREQQDLISLLQKAAGIAPVEKTDAD